MVPALLEILDRKGLERDRIVLLSFHQPVLREVKKTDPGFKTLWLTQVRKGSGKNGWIPSMKKVLDTLKQIVADGISTGYRNINEDFVTTIREHGYEYHVWTVDQAVMAENSKNGGLIPLQPTIPRGFYPFLDRKKQIEQYHNEQTTHDTVDTETR